MIAWHNRLSSVRSSVRPSVRPYRGGVQLGEQYGRDGEGSAAAANLQPPSLLICTSHIPKTIAGRITPRILWHSVASLVGRRTPQWLLGETQVIESITRRRLIASLIDWVTDWSSGRSVVYWSFDGLEKWPIQLSLRWLTDWFSCVNNVTGIWTTLTYYCLTESNRIE